LDYTNKAVDSARAARKKRWICFFILVTVLIIVAIVVAVVITQHINVNKSSNNSG
jgi:syntaxin 1B/2/3